VFTIVTNHDPAEAIDVDGIANYFFVTRHNRSHLTANRATGIFE
jgi:hypothetical protein